MIFNAFALGLSTGSFCLGYCFPVAAPLLLSRKAGSFKEAAVDLGKFLCGRLCAYLLVGFIIGLVGSYTQEVVFFQQRIVPVLFIVLGLMMVVYGVFSSLPHLNLCGLSARSFEKGRHLFIAGFLVGLNLCPPFLLALSYAVGFGEVLRSMLFFFFFFLATSVYLLPFLFSGLLSRFARIRLIARLAGVIAGFWFTVIGLMHVKGAL